MTAQSRTPKQQSDAEEFAGLGCLWAIAVFAGLLIWYAAAKVIAVL